MLVIIKCIICYNYFVHLNASSHEHCSVLEHKAYAVCMCVCVCVIYILSFRQLNRVPKYFCYLFLTMFYFSPKVSFQPAILEFYTLFAGALST